MFEIRLDGDSIYLSDTGYSKQVFANIYIQYEYHNFFPQEKWNDFVIVIMTWWLKAFISGVDNKDTKIIFGFMDGDYSISMDIQKYGGKVHCKFVSNQKVIGSCETTLIEIRRELLQTANEIIRTKILDDKNMDFYNLKKLFKELQLIPKSEFS